MTNTDLEHYVVVFDLLEEIPDPYLERLRVRFAEGAAGKLSPGMTLFYQAVSAILETEGQRREAGAEPVAVSLAVGAGELPNDEECQAVLSMCRRWSARLRESEPAVAAFFWTVGAALAGAKAQRRMALGRLN